jgi:malate dehydrogenase
VQLVDKQYLQNDFVKTVQQRGAAVIAARGSSSAMSAARAITDHMRDWWLGTRPGEWVSMGVYSDGSYGVPKGIVFSYPLTIQNGKWSIVQGINIDDFGREKLKITADELLAEKNLAVKA